MPIKARIFEALVYRIVVVLLVCVLSGCGSQSAQLPTYMRPELLYLNHQPYSRLYVEVDTIEGVEVPDKWLDDLKAFLSKYCSKPDGIDIVQDKAVPVSEIEALPASMASILCLDGPVADSSGQAAYLHVFLYDTDVGLRDRKREPHVDDSCPCGIFLNVDYAWRWSTYMTKHETGHVLGLCKNTTHGDGTHCRNYGCLMYRMPDLWSRLGSLVGPPPDGQLCADCQGDLEVWKSEGAEANLIFKGPFLIRQEDGYSVASLPYCDLLIPAPMAVKFDWQDILHQIKADIKGKDFKEYYKKGTPRIWALYFPTNKGASPGNTPEALSILTKATNDPCPLVRRYVAEELEKLKQKQER